MSITVNKDIVNVDLTVESTSLTQDAFSTICFITQGDSKLPDNVFVNKLDDLLNAGYLRDSKAYNFCYGVFLQGKLNNILVRRCLSSESYLDCYKKYNNNSFYYLVLESKLISDIVSVGNYLDSIKAIKTLFFSSSEDFSKDLKGIESVVYYYLDSLDKPIDVGNYLLFDDGSTVLIDENQPIIFYEDDVTTISCEGATSSKEFPDIYLNGYNYVKMDVANLKIVELDFNGNEKDTLLDLDLEKELGLSNPTSTDDKVLVVGDFSVLFTTEYSSSSGYIYKMVLTNNSLSNKAVKVTTKNIPQDGSVSTGFVAVTIDYDEQICLTSLEVD